MFKWFNLSTDSSGNCPPATPWMSARFSDNNMSDKRCKNSNATFHEFILVLIQKLSMFAAIGKLKIKEK